MKQFFSEIYRLKIPQIILILSCLFFGFEDYFMSFLLIGGFISLAMILGHLVGKELFGKYKWDVGKRLNEAWGAGSIPNAILATGMLMARVLIYVAVLITMALMILLMKGKAFGEIPERAKPYIPILQEEHQRLWPESDISIIASQCQAESSWKEGATRKEPSGVISYGLMQVLDRTFNEMKTRHKILTDADPVKMLQARWGIRAGILYDKDMWKLCYFADSEKDRYAFMLSSYNGGYGWLQRDRRIAEAKGRNKNKWFCNVQHHSSRSKWAFEINRKYIVKIFKFAKNYRGYFKCQK